MTFYFIGGEDHDFTKIGVCSVDTATTTVRRTANSRCTLKVGVNAATTDGWSASLDAARSSLWLTARIFGVSGAASNAIVDFISFMDGTNRRLGIDFTQNSNQFRLYKKTAAGTKTTLVTSAVNFSFSVLQKIDVQIVYGTSGLMNLYLDGTLIATYSGDLTTDGATSLSGFVLGSTSPTNSASVSTYWSEVICGLDDTRSLNLVTLAPSANGNAFAWTNSYANLSEVTLDDTTLCSSSTAGDLAQMTVSSGGITGNPAIRAVCISARAQKGASGPQNLQMNVRTGGNDYFSSNLALPAAFNRVAYTFESNPATSGAWAYTDLTAAGFNVGIKSIA